MFKENLLKNSSSKEKLVKLISLFVKKDIINFCDEDNRTILMAASISGYKEAVELLISNGADVNAKVNSNCQNVLDRSCTALIYASREGYKEIVELLIQNGADIDAKDFIGMNSLIHAINAKNIEIAKLLIEKGINIHSEDIFSNTAIVDAQKEIVELLIEKGAKYNLFDLIKIGDFKKVKELINQGDENFYNDNGTQALMSAIHKEEIEIIEFLIEKGADINYKCESLGETQLMILSNLTLATSSSSKQKEIAQLLINKGAYLNVKSNIGMTALMCAAGSGQIEVAELLINSQADIHSQDAQGWTALMYSAFNSQVKILKLLIENGADINVKDKNGNTALTLAKEKGYKKIVDILKNHSKNERLSMLNIKIL